MKKYHHHKSLQGFTLTELIMVVVIMGVTLSIGLPSFQQIISNARLTTSVNIIISALQMARSEAIKKVQNIGVTVNVVTAQCPRKEIWGVAGAQQFDLPNNIKVIPNNGFNPMYRPDGRINGLAGHFVFSDISSEKTLNNHRLLNIANTGRVTCCKWIDTDWFRCDNSSKLCSSPSPNPPDIEIIPDC